MSLIDKIDPAKQEILEQTGALLSGHFRLSSGLHSAHYFQCARLLQFPPITARIAEDIATPSKDLKIDVVISPAVGGIVLGYEIARVLGCRGIFTERKDEKMTLRRGFVLEAGENVLIAEDVITTGGSVVEIKDLVQAVGAELKGFAAIVDRSGGTFFPTQPFSRWISLQVETFEPQDCPLCKKGIPLEYPGSKQIKSS